MRISDWSSDVCSSDLKRETSPSSYATLSQGHITAFTSQSLLQIHGAVRPQRRNQPTRACWPSDLTRCLFGHQRGLSTLARRSSRANAPDRKSVGSGKRVSVRVDVGGGRMIKKK